MRRKIKRKIEDIKYVVKNVDLLFSYKKDIGLMREMVSTLHSQLTGLEGNTCNVSNYNKVSLEFRRKYERINNIVLKYRMRDLINLVVSIKFKKNDLDLKKKSGKRKFVLCGRVFWERSYQKARVKSNLAWNEERKSRL